MVIDGDFTGVGDGTGEDVGASEGITDVGLVEEGTGSGT
jgi:hypothetical protein